MQIPVDIDQQLIFKNNLKQYCLDTIQERITAVQNNMKAAQQNANSEEKSSAGDKYETSRAMSHLEKDMQARQLAEHLKELSSVHTITTNTIYSTVSMGAFIQCDKVSFFLGGGLGKQVIDGQTILFLSQKAPLTQLLLNKQKGDTFLFNGPVTIQEIF